MRSSASGAGGESFSGSFHRGNPRAFRPASRRASRPANRRTARQAVLRASRRAGAPRSASIYTFSSSQRTRSTIKRTASRRNGPRQSNGLRQMSGPRPRSANARSRSYCCSPCLSRFGGSPCFGRPYRSILAPRRSPRCTWSWAFGPWRRLSRSYSRSRRSTGSAWQVLGPWLYSFNRFLSAGLCAQTSGTFACRNAHTTAF